VVSYYIIIIENDREIYPSDLYESREMVEKQLAWVREAWTDRYGADAFDADFEADDSDIVAILDGPYARIHELDVAQGLGSLA